MMIDHAAIDQVLDDFNKILKFLQVQYHLNRAKIERWRWDIPQISLSWLAEDAIWRNINVFVNIEHDVGSHFYGQIEVNAWQDFQRANRWTRRWRHENTYSGIIEDVSSSRKYDDIFTHSYDLVARWTLDDLKTEQPLSSAAAELLEQQHASRFTPPSQQSPQSPRRAD